MQISIIHMPEIHNETQDAGAKTAKPKPRKSLFRRAEKECVHGLRTTAAIPFFMFSLYFLYKAAVKKNVWSRRKEKRVKMNPSVFYVYQIPRAQRIWDHQICCYLSTNFLCNIHHSKNKSTLPSYCCFPPQACVFFHLLSLQSYPWRPEIHYKQNVSQSAICLSLVLFCISRISSIRFCVIQ